MNFAPIIIGVNLGYESRERRIDRVSSLKNIRKRDYDLVLLCVIIGGVGRQYVYKA